MTTKMGARPARAYVLGDRTDYVESNQIVFAETARAARQHGLEGVAYIDTTARRAPEFDALAGAPAEAYTRAKLAAGWWFECGACGARIDGEDEPAGVVDGEEVFCDARCHARAVGARRGYEFARLECVHIEREARRRWPEATATGGMGAGYFRGAYPKEPLPADGFRMQIRLNFPRRGLWATWVEGDADLTRLAFEPLARGVVTTSMARVHAHNRERRRTGRTGARRGHR